MGGCDDDRILSLSRGDLTIWLAAGEEYIMSTASNSFLKIVTPSIQNPPLGNVNKNLLLIRKWS